MNLSIFLTSIVKKCANQTINKSLKKILQSQEKILTGHIYLVVRQLKWKALLSSKMRFKISILKIGIESDLHIKLLLWASSTT